jgi:hypothetical protein
MYDLRMVLVQGSPDAANRQLPARQRGTVADDHF